MLMSSLFLCKAATDFSRDVPSNVSKEMSQYEKIIEGLTTLFPVWVILGAIIGIYKPSMDEVTISDHMDLLVEQVKMLAGDIAFGTSTLKCLLEQSVNDPKS